jgi:hypothetical protein
MPEENPPQIGCPYRATPSDIKIVNGQPNQKICDRKRDCTDRPKDKPTKNERTMAPELIDCVLNRSRLTLTDKQPAESIASGTQAPQL